MAFREFLINLRGVRSAGLVFMAPTYLFVATLGGTIAFGLVRQVLGSGVEAVREAVSPPHAGAAAGVGLWLFLRAFAAAARP